LEAIFIKNPKNRIKINELKNMKFFKDINFNKLIQCGYPAPFIPDLVNIFFSNFLIFS